MALVHVLVFVCPGCGSQFAVPLDDVKPMPVGNAVECFHCKLQGIARVLNLTTEEVSSL